MGLAQRIKSKVVLEGASKNANRDLLPSPVAWRTWNWWSYTSLWAGESFDANQWNTGSSFISVGLTVKQTIAPVLIGDLLAAVAAVLNASFGAHYHVGFPAMIRSTFGVKGSKWFVGLRGLVCIIWYAVQIYYTTNLLDVSLRCIFGYKWNDWNPPVPSSAGTSARILLCYFFTWTMALPIALIHPAKLKSLFNARVFIGPTALFVMFIWCTVLGQTDPKGFAGFDILQANPLSGSALAWAMISGVNSVMASISPMITSMSDVSRYARTPSQSGWPQGAAIFIGKSVSSFMSVVAAASLQSRYGGEAQWNIWDQLNLLLDENWDAKTRFGCLVVALFVAFSCLVTNAYCNTLPFGADISAIFPRYINMRRGQILIALVSLPILPWEILANAPKFLTFLGSYTFLMGAILGCLWGDFLYRNGNYHVPSMFNYEQGSLYMFWKGYNWRGWAAWTVSFAIIFPGLVAAYIPESMSIAAQQIYSMGWVISVATSLVMYYLFNYLFPVPILPKEYADAPEGHRWLGMSPLNGIFPGEVIEGFNDREGDDSLDRESSEDDKSVHKVDAISGKV